MKINKKILLLSSLVLIVVGTVVTVAGFALGGRPGFEISREGIQTTADDYVTMKKERIEEINSIDMSIQYADFSIIPSDDYYLEYKLEGKSSDFICDVKNGKLTFKENGKIGVFIGVFNLDFIGENCYVKLYVPKEKYFDTVKVYNESGNISFDTLHCAQLNMEIEYGNLKGNQLISSKKADIMVDSGDIDIEKAEFNTLNIENEYGDVDFQNIICKVADISMDSGDFECNNADFMDLNIENEYGNITLNLLPAFDAYDFKLSVEYGDVDANGLENTHEKDDEESFVSNNGKDRKITAYCDSGDIRVN